MRRVWLFSLLFAAIAVAALWQVSRARCFQLIGDVTCRVETAQRLVALSFDDGPTAEGLDAILPRLTERGITATFFLIGREIEQHRGQTERLVAAGQELGNHSYSHRRMIGHSPSFYRDEIGRTDALLKQAGIARPVLLRPPYGKRLIGLPLAAQQAGYRIVTWDVEDSDAVQLGPRALADRIVSQARPGSIILIHAMYRGDAVQRQALGPILDGLAAKGLRVVSVGELLQAGAGG